MRGRGKSGPVGVSSWGPVLQKVGAVPVGRNAGEGQLTISRAGLVVRWDWPTWRLVGEAVAPGEKTWKALTDEAKRPRTEREGVNHGLLDVIAMWISCC